MTGERSSPMTVSGSSLSLRPRSSSATGLRRCGARSRTPRIRRSARRSTSPAAIRLQAWFTIHCGVDPPTVDRSRSPGGSGRSSASRVAGAGVRQEICWTVCSESMCAKALPPASVLARRAASAIRLRVWAMFGRRLVICPTPTRTGVRGSMGVESNVTVLLTRIGEAGACPSGSTARSRSSPALGSGMGRATTLRFLDEGASVVVADFNEQTGAGTIDLAKEAGHEKRVRFIRTDVAKESDVDAHGRRSPSPSSAGSTSSSTTPASAARSDPSRRSARRTGTTRSTSSRRARSSGSSTALA